MCFPQPELRYPDPRYLGDGGEISASYRPAHESYDLAIGTSKVTYLATGGSTDGRFGLYRFDLEPRAPGAGPHFHRTISESFFILDGSIRVFDGKQWIDTAPGDYLYVPEGGIHAFGNETSDDPASTLILFAPGAPREAFFEAGAEIAAGREISEADWIELFRRHDNHFVSIESARDQFAKYGR